MHQAVIIDRIALKVQILKPLKVSQVSQTCAGNRVGPQLEVFKLAQWSEGNQAGVGDGRVTRVKMRQIVELANGR